MDIKGKVHEVGTTQQVSETFKKRELIVEYAENPTYPEYLKFEAINDKCDALNELKAGDEVTVYFNLRGRPWTDKTGKTSYFNSLVLWKFDVNKTVAGEATQYETPVNASASSEDDDLPF